MSVMKVFSRKAAKTAQFFVLFARSATLREIVVIRYWILEVKDSMRGDHLSIAENPMTNLQ
jgi:hypothetical protein